MISQDLENPSPVMEDHHGKWDKARGKPGKHKEEVHVCVLGGGKGFLCDL